VIMGVGSGGQGGHGSPMDFHTWCKYSIDRGLKVPFFAVFVIFRSFFRWPPLEDAK